MNRNVTVFEHPLITHKISLMRDENTSSKQFRELVEEIAMLMAYEVFRDLPLKDVTIKTPVSEATVKVLSCKDVAIVPILRAGLGMTGGILNLFPTAKVGHIGLYRRRKDARTARILLQAPRRHRKPTGRAGRSHACDGGSANAAVNFLKARGCKDVKFMCLIAAPEGIKAFTDAHPDIPLYCAALDEKLNESGYIVPASGTRATAFSGRNK